MPLRQQSRQSRPLALAQTKAFVETTPRLDHATSNSAAKGLPDISILPEQGAFLSFLCKLLNAKSVLELGTLGGYSTIWLADSVPNIKVTRIEIDPTHHSVA